MDKVVPSQWVVDFCEVFGLIFVLSVIAFLVFVLAVDDFYRYRKNKAMKDYYNNLSMEEKSVIDKYNAVDVPFWFKKK